MVNGVSPNRNGPPHPCLRCCLHGDYCFVRLHGGLSDVPGSPGMGGGTRYPHCDEGEVQ